MATSDEDIERRARALLPAVTNLALTRSSSIVDRDWLEHIKAVTRPDDTRRFRLFSSVQSAAEYLGIGASPLRFRAAMTKLEEQGRLNIARRNAGTAFIRTLSIDDVVTIGRQIDGLFIKRSEGDPVITVAVANQKGGVGKTVTAANLATYIASIKGARVLLVDCDPQGTNTRGFVPFLPPEALTVGDLILNASTEGVDHGELVRGAIQRTHVPNLDIVPASNNDSGVEHELAAAYATEEGWHLRLHRMLKTVECQYDVVIIDTAPTHNLAALQAVAAANALLIPTGADYYELHSLRSFISFLHTTFPAIKHQGLYWCKVLITRFHHQGQWRVAANISAKLGRMVLENFAIRSEAVGWATSKFGSVFELDPTGMSRRDRKIWQEAVTNTEAYCGEITTLVESCWPSRAGARTHDVISDPAFLLGVALRAVQQQLEEEYAE